MKFGDYVNEKKLMDYSEHTGITTKDKGHSHEYFLKRMSGDGATSYDKGHLHKIKAMVVIKANDHTHSLKT